METLRRPLAVIVGLTAVAVLVHFVLGPVYEDAVESGDVWNILNWFMAFAVVVALVVTFRAKRDAESGDCDTKTYFAVNAKFYTAAALAVLFFRNWVDEMAGGGSDGDVNGNYWVLIDTIYVILMAWVSLHLWTHTPRDQQ